ncbi:MAG: hypothetical protein VX644_02265 [Planctomycetota bacterium]|nr:hypothetical protein [Planctomycetota bacterium]
MDFKERLGKAIDRGADRRDKQQGKAQDQALTEEELKRLHAQYRRDLSEHIEACVDQIANHFPGFQVETIVGERGWGAAISRDDFGVNAAGRRENNYSRLEMTIRPFATYHVVDLAAKATIYNKELFNRNHFEKVADAEADAFRELIDTWALEFAELFAASSS